MGPLLVWTTAAAVTAVVVDPPRPDAEVPWLAAAAFGVVAGATLFAVIPRRPSRHRLRATTATLLTTNAFLAVCVLNEELIWRRLILGELLVAGPALALAVSSVAFAVVHRRHRATHVLTGVVFGGAYLATGALAAAIAAHLVYNALLASAAGAPRSRAEAAG